VNQNVGSPQTEFLRRPEGPCGASKVAHKTRCEVERYGEQSEVDPPNCRATRERDGPQERSTCTGGHDRASLWLSPH
jgi:hypothetical protein